MYNTQAAAHFRGSTSSMSFSAQMIAAALTAGIAGHLNNNVVSEQATSSLS